MLTDRKEQLYITAIQNLRKQLHYRELHEEFEKNEITEDEFTKQLEENGDKYVINVTPIEDENDIYLIQDIIEKIGNDEYSTSDVGDLFSISTIPVDPFLKLKEKL